MPDILIRGMEMPKYGCAGCYFKTGKYCGIISKNENVEEYSLRAERHPDCPIHELPQHGDLISRDAVLNKIEAYVCGSQDSEFIKNEIIKAMPVIIPAEKGETQ